MLASWHSAAQRRASPSSYLRTRVGKSLSELWSAPALSTPHAPRASPLTDGYDEQHEQEGVEHGRDRRRKAGDDVLEGAEAAEDADDAERPHHAQDGDGHVEGAEGENGEEHDRGVDEVVGVAEEGREPVRVGVHRELDREDAREADVQGVEQPAGVGEGAVGADHLAVELRLGGVDDEVLRAMDGQSRA